MNFLFKNVSSKLMNYATLTSSKKASSFVAASLTNFNSPLEITEVNREKLTENQVIAS